MRGRGLPAVDQRMGAGEDAQVPVVLKCPAVQGRFRLIPDPGVYPSEIGNGVISVDCRHIARCPMPRLFDPMQVIAGESPRCDAYPLSLTPMIREDEAEVGWAAGGAARKA